MNKVRATVLAVSAIASAASGFYFGNRSRLNLNETLPPMVAVAECAIKRTMVDFVIIDGMRTDEEQRGYVAGGVSWTLRSRHLTGHAIDVAAWVDGKISYRADYYTPIAAAFYSCSTALAVPIIWGGEWKKQDLMHFELDRKVYP